MKYEIWKPVVGFEGRYEVSSLGRVRSLAYILATTIAACIKASISGVKKIVYGYRQKVA